MDRLVGELQAWMKQQERCMDAIFAGQSRIESMLAEATGGPPPPPPPMQSGWDFKAEGPAGLGKDDRCPARIELSTWGMERPPPSSKPAGAFREDFLGPQFSPTMQPTISGPMPRLGPELDVCQEGMRGNTSAKLSNASRPPTPEAFSFGGDRCPIGDMPESSEVLGGAGDGSPRGQRDSEDEHSIARPGSRRMTRPKFNRVDSAVIMKDVRMHWTINSGYSDIFAGPGERFRSPTALKLIKTMWYENMVMLMIFLNTFFIGWQVQHHATSGRFAMYEEPLIFEVCEKIFLGFFAVEIIMRIAAFGTNFLSGSEAWWNAFDFVIVVMMLAEELEKMMMSSSSSLGQAAALRTLRAVRVLRAFRMLYFAKYLQSLRVLLQTVIIALKSMVWTSVVVILLLYIFGVVFTQGVIDHCGSKGDCVDTAGTTLLMRFGRIDRSLLSLFEAMTNGLSWTVYMEALQDVPVFYHGLFIVYIAVACFAIMNVVTGIFVETTMRVAHVDRDALVQEEVKNKQNYMIAAAQVFRDMDTDGSNEVTVEEFKKAMKDRRVLAYINALQLDFTDVMTLFVLLDRDSSGSINLDEFLRGCMRLKGEAKSIDIAKLQYQSEWLMHTVSVLRSDSAWMRGALAEQLQAISDAVALPKPHESPSKDSELSLGASAATAPPTVEALAQLSGDSPCESPEELAARSSSLPEVIKRKRTRMSTLGSAASSGGGVPISRVTPDYFPTGSGE